jgi:hypothetical protein
MGGAKLGVAHMCHDMWGTTVIGGHSKLTFITGSGFVEAQGCGLQVCGRRPVDLPLQRRKGQGLGLRWFGFEAESGVDNLGSNRRNRFLITAFPAFSGKYSSWAAEM